MNNPTQTNETLMSLAVRVEEATGADRELDCAIAVAALGFVVEPEKYPGGGPLYCYTQEDGTYLRPGQAGDMLVRKFTASLDAAMTLVPEGCAIDFRRFTDGKARAAVWRTVTHPEPAFEHHCERAATAALAVLAAALKARAHSGERE